MDTDPISLVDSKSEVSDGATIEDFKYKGLLHNYAQVSSVPLPVYQTVNLGSSHDPQFKSSVTIDGETFESTSTFTHRKEAERNVSRVAFEGLSRKIKADSVSHVRKDTVFCKSILIEYAVKMKIDHPKYTTYQTQELLPSFFTSVAFNGKTYTGSTGKNKKEAEQIAARTAIESILDSDTDITLPQIIKSKRKLFDAFYKAKGQDVGSVGKVDTNNVDSVSTGNDKSYNAAHAEPLCSGDEAKPSAVSPDPAELLKPKKEVWELTELGGSDKSSQPLKSNDSIVPNDCHSKTRIRRERRNRARAKRARADEGPSMYPETLVRGTLPVNAEADAKRTQIDEGPSNVS